MSGNKNSGRKTLKIPSFEIRFQMDGRYKKQLEKNAKNIGVGFNQYIKYVLMQDLETN